MNRKQKIIVSTTGIFLVLLILVGLTYAYFLTRINGNKNDKSISVSTANLELVYADVNDTLISATNIEPGVSFTKMFSATNNGNKKIDEYGVALENVINTLERTEDLVYTISCTQYLKQGYSITKDGNNYIVNGTTSGTCNGVSEEQIFPTMGKILVTNSIEDDKVQVYTLVVTYKDTGTDQSIDMNKQFSAKANLVNPSTFGPMGSGTLASAIIDSAEKASETSDTTRTTFGTRVTEFTSISGENERVLNNAPDDYGTSYYYRGNVLDNYVSFANKTWRIVRINGDGSVRIVLDEVVGNENFNYYGYDDNAHVGYMYGMTGQTESNVNQCIVYNDTNKKAKVDTINNTEETCIANGGKWAPTPYDATHVNVVSSNVKTILENWYKTNIIDTYNESYVADTLFCNDKTLASNTIGSKNTAKGYGKNITYYSSTERLRYSSGLINITTPKPTFECAKGATNTYSRFTSNSVETIKGVKVNSDLTYPIGLLTADEVVYAGAYDGSQGNKTFYLYNPNISSTSTWWLMSPGHHSGSDATEWYVASTSWTIFFTLTRNVFSLRPTLNIKASVLISDGDGTKENPYQIKLS